MNSDFSKKCYVILVNEIAPRAKKLNLPISSFIPSRLSGYLARLEYEGVITRKQLRELLDEQVRHLSANKIG